MILLQDFESSALKRVPPPVHIVETNRGGRACALTLLKLEFKFSIGIMPNPYSYKI